jgi:hypothetical protein
MGHTKLFYMLEQPAISVQFLFHYNSWIRNYLTSSPRKLLLTFFVFRNWFKKVVRWKNLAGRVNQQEIQLYLDSSETTRRDFSVFISLFFQKFMRIFYSKNKMTRFFILQLKLKQMVALLSQPRLVSLTSNNFFSFARSSSSLPQPYKFQEFIQFRPSHKQASPVPNDSLEWFIGFVEGDGSFMVKENRPIFVINQADLKVLYFIRSLLGFGVVRTFNQDGRIYGRYVVGTKDGVRCLIALFNGNLQLEKVQKRFAEWVQCYNQAHNESIPIQSQSQSSDIALNSGWLAGLFDAEGGFHSHIKVSEIRYRGTKNPPPARPIRFRKRLYVKAYLDQQFELDTLTQIGKLFNGTVFIRDSSKQHYRVELHSKDQLILLMNYFQKYSLKSRKADAYAIWKKLVHLYVNSLHLSKMDELQKPVDRLKKINNLFKQVKDVLVLLQKQADQYLP